MKEIIIVNPFTDLFINSVNNSNGKLKIAVPYISSFARKIFGRSIIKKVSDKRIITKFDESNLNTFDLPTLEYLIDSGFEIIYNNNIHLKLYITDDETFITSSNLTKGGFENNIELTVNIDSDNIEKSEQIFENLWNESKSNIITKNLINENMAKYKVLKKRQKFNKSKVVEIRENFKMKSLDIQSLLNDIFINKDDYNWQPNKIYEANKTRTVTKKDLINNKFNTNIFYAPNGHPRRNNNLYYYFVYGAESRLAGTGLREAQFKDVFEHTDFKNVIDFVFPESISMKPLNLFDDNVLLNFCNGIFDFGIPQYAETLPIRLASFFYPDFFIPIYRLKDLKIVCETLGLESKAKTKGEKLYVYNKFLNDKMSDILPISNYLKSNLTYQILYAVELFKRIENGEDFNSIKMSYKEKWKKNYISKGLNILKRIKAL